MALVFSSKSRKTNKTYLKSQTTLLIYLKEFSEATPWKLLHHLAQDLTQSNRKLQIFLLTIRSNGSCVLAALSSSSLYSSSSHSLCSVLSGSLSCTGIVTLERSLPMLFLRMFHRLMLLLLGLGEGRQDLRWQRAVPSSAEPGNTCSHVRRWRHPVRRMLQIMTGHPPIVLCLSLPEFCLSLSVPLLKLSMEMLSLMSLMYESSSDA